MTLLPYQGGDFYSLQTLPNDTVDNIVHDIDDDDDDDEEMMAMMMTNSVVEDGSDLVMKSRQGLKSSWKKLKHAKSEQKRRQRINSHHATLRALFPNLLKKDKASVLTEAVRRVRELKKMVDDIAHEDGSGGEEWFRSLPSEKDEASVSYCEGGKEGTKSVRMTICREDSPIMIRQVMDAIRSVRGRAVSAEMSTVGGRTKVVVVVEWSEGGGGGEEDVGSLRRALRAMVENRAFEYTGLMGYSSSDIQWAGMAHDVLEPGPGPGLVSDSGKDSLAEGLILRSSV